MPKITDIKAREIIDSRGNPTVETAVYCDSGIFANAAVPSGASKGTHEALELRDDDPARFNGQGVMKAVKNVNTIISRRLIGLDIDNQEKIDKLMLEIDGTDDKSQIGANSILSVSLACARTSALSFKLPLYEYIRRLYSPDIFPREVIPMFNIINGGLHGSGKLDFQEYLLIPDKGYNFVRSYQIGVEIYQLLKKFLQNKSLNHSVGDEGGFTPQLMNNDEPIHLLHQVIENSCYKYNSDVHIGLDLASSVFYSGDKYRLEDRRKILTSQEFIDYLLNLYQKHDIYSLEDPLSEDDWNNWQILTKKLGNDIIIIGDDLLVTNKKRLQKAIDLKACNAILVKLNQIGTLTETLEVISLARSAGFKIIISHRSGETNDDFIADFAVGVGADFVKFGAPARGERIAKYNRLLEIYQKV